MTDKNPTTVARCTILPTLIVFILTATYAIFRYHIIQNEPWSRFPLFVFNKVVSWSAVILYLGAAYQGLVVQVQSRWVPLFRHAMVLSILHVLISLSLLRPVDYPVLFDPDGRLFFSASMMLISGIFALVTITSVRRKNSHVSWLFPMLVFAHVAFLGWTAWWSPKQWAGGLPPISLLSAIAALALLWLGLKSRFPRKVNHSDKGISR